VVDVICNDRVGELRVAMNRENNSTQSILIKKGEDFIIGRDKSSHLSCEGK
jgi:hypothetical protein